ncbi:hypothetical protein [Uliginosibacterium gangwonense]|uniref:hypothetical protein n=1 Tax=Uliginosibacterium gangwonense TaxID=392736 RepID=UPI0012F88F9E|nr:hypothetical protein [Uliginosibacterium gangwonense]
MSIQKSDTQAYVSKNEPELQIAFMLIAFSSRRKLERLRGGKAPPPNSHTR